MSAIEKWAERIYAEADFGRSVATSLAGLLGLGIYLKLGDWVIAAFISIIFFPIARLTATALHERFVRSSKRRTERESAEHIYSCLSDEERVALYAFISAGGCVVTWGQMNKSPASATAIESLIQRGVLSTSLTADGMRETFVLDPDLFDIGLSHAKELAVS